MSCPSPVLHSMYADGALPAAEAATLEQHVATCTACRARMESWRGEREALRGALHALDDLAPIPDFVPQPRQGGFIALALTVLALGGFSTTFWSGLAASIPIGLRWLNPFDWGELAERAVDLVTFMLYEGTAMWTATLNIIAVVIVVGFAGWLAAAAARKRTVVGAFAVLLAVVTALPSIGHAFERREGELVTVAADETINDTLLAAGETVSIDGNVNGDLLAFGRSVTVRGNVTGNLISAAETVRVEGTVGGSVIGAGRALSLTNTRIGGDLYGFGRDLELGAGADVSGNAIAFGQNIDMDGRVGVDFTGFAETLTIGGAVDGDVVGYGATVTLLPSARVSGDVIGHVDSAGDLNIASGAVVRGNIDEQLVEPEERRNRYLTVGFYTGQIVRLGAAFVTGLLLFWLFPVLRDVSLPDAGAVLRSGGIGLAAAVTLPVAALVLCLTIVGLPIGLLAFALGAVGLYFSKAVVAQIVGRRVFQAPQGPPHFAATLLAGLVIVMVVINLPFIGGIVDIVLTLVGFGIIVSLLTARFNRGSLA